MNRTALPTLIGVLSSLIAIWFIHSFLIIEDCTDNTGTYDYQSAQCLMTDGSLYESPHTSYALAIYFIVGFAVSFIVSHFIRKWFNRQQ